MRKIKSLKDTIPYAKLYNQLKQFHQDKRGFSKGGFVMGGLSMDDGTPVNGFSPQFYQSELAQMVADDANSLLQNQLDKAKLSLKTPYDVKENATSMDALGELFGVFNEEADKKLEDVPTVSLSPVKGTTYFPDNESFVNMDSSDLRLPLATKAMYAEGLGQYDTLLADQGKSKDSPFKNVKVNTMKIKDVAEFAKKNGKYHKYNLKKYKLDSTAVGFYQILGGTINDILDRGGKELGITGDTIFDKKTQDKMYVWYMSDTISRKKTLNGMMQNVMRRWASFRDESKTKKDSQGKKIYTPKNANQLKGVIYEHLNKYHPDHPMINSLGAKRAI
tara:strand:+ start:18884 stop:19882 length:999 start_codon:yes stop_codon:yes gene_type:complete